MKSLSLLAIREIIRPELNQLFQIMRENGLKLTYDDYDLLQKAIEKGYGLKGWSDLKQVCKRLWVKPSLNYAEDAFERAFEIFQAQCEEGIQEVKQKPGTSEQKPGTSEQKPESPEQKPESPKQKPESPELKPQPSEQKPQLSEQKPQSSELKPQSSEQKPQSSEQKPQPPEQKPQPSKLKPQSSELKPQPPELKPRTPPRPLPKIPPRVRPTPASSPVKAPIAVNTPLLPSKFHLRPIHLPIQLNHLKPLSAEIRFLREEEELDLEATYRLIEENGFFVDVVMRPVFTPSVRWLIFVDQGGVMIPYRLAFEPILEAVARRWLSPAEVFRFNNYPGKVVFGEQDPEDLDRLLNRQNPACTIALIWSDAGAAANTSGPIYRQKIAEFLDRLKPCVRHIFWINPLPPSRWIGNSAESIARILEGTMIHLDPLMSRLIVQRLKQNTQYPDGDAL